MERGHVSYTNGETIAQVIPSTRDTPRKGCDPIEEEL